MRILLIDTCTERGIIAYGNQTESVFVIELPFGPAQSKFLMPYLSEALKSLGLLPPVDLIGVGIGPGSYTGIRLGAAVAQSLAYSWKIPLVGVSSLEGFVPSIPSIPSPLLSYAAVLDARIGGVYYQTGSVDQAGTLHRNPPKVASLEEAGKDLREVTHFVTPLAKSLQIKLKHYYPNQQWIWEEKAPSAHALLKSVEQSYLQGNFVISPGHLDLLYLRQTEAEREKALRQQKNEE